MASTINASTTSTSGLVYNADASGVLQLQSNGVTGLTIDTGGKVVLPSLALGTAVAGEIEYDGRVPYFTPTGTQRGVVPGMQYYRLNSGFLGENSSSVQKIFGVGVTLSGNTVYCFESVFAMGKTVGSTGYTTSVGFGGTATANNCSYFIQSQADSVSWTSVPYSGTVFNMFVQTNAHTNVLPTQNGAIVNRVFTIKGTVSINAGGTFIPEYALSAAPGGAYTTQAGSYFLIYPIGSAGSNTSVGTWA